MLPSPLPDDPRKWDGWNRFSSPDPYERLGLSFEANPTHEEIEENTRLLLVWWQKKLPLKNQPSNPLAQLLRGGMDTAPRFLAEARTELLNPERRKQIDLSLREKQRLNAINEFKKFLDFALTDKVLTAEAEANLDKLGRGLGLSGGDIAGTIAIELKRMDAVREADLPPAPEPPPEPEPVTAAAAPSPAAPVAVRAPLAPTLEATPRTRRVRQASPRDDFWRMLRLSGLDEESMSDDRRDTFIDMAENMGLDPGAAEDMVDEYLEAVADGTLEATVAPSSPMAAERAVAPSPPTVAKKIPPRSPNVAPVVRPAAPPPAVAKAVNPIVSAKITESYALPKEIGKVAENSRFDDFVNGLGTTMLFLPQATFTMGSNAPGAPGNEQPAMRVTLGRFYMGKLPITNAEYEKFDPAHKSRRGAWADERHPVIYVSYLDAVRFCQWLSSKERKRYRLPTEAEWEYAAKGTTEQPYPWGTTTGLGTLGNFADANTTFPWRDASINDGYAETAPVGSYPDGVSFCGVEDLSGNVWEWCQDWYDAYKGGERTNPRGPASGTQRVYRGGSWKSRFSSLKTTTRGYNLPTYASNDVGFRIVCECD